MALIMVYISGVFITFLLGLIHNKIIFKIDLNVSKINLFFILFSWIMTVILIIWWFFVSIEQNSDLTNKSFFRFNQ